MQRLARVVAVVACITCATGCGVSTHKVVSGTAPSPAAARQTAVHIYAPYSEEAKLTVAVAKTVPGDCFVGSIISQRSDAWRCSAGNELLDPCFSGMLNARSVVCPMDGPWSGRVVRITLTRGLPTGNTGTTAPLTDPAWAIELSDGGHCVFLAGTSTIVADLRENYQCTNGVTLYGAESRSVEPWTIFGRAGAAGQLTPEQIAAIWF